ncbi:MAG: hypothetical protein NDJ90_06120 [Oligoflexia bacterium]|nr:hypothetical protein [Oligoflexia bacterium]
MSLALVSRSGQSLVSIMTGLGLMSLMFLGLNALIIDSTKMTRNLSYDVDAMSVMTHLQMALSNFNGDCRYNFALNASVVFATPEFAPPTSLVHVNQASSTTEPLVVPANGLVVDGMTVRNLQLISTQGSMQNHTGDLQVRFRKTQGTFMGSPTLTKSAPLMFLVDTSSGTPQIVDCATTAASVTKDLASICGSILGPNGNAVWNDNGGSGPFTCQFP